MQKNMMIMLVAIIVIAAVAVVAIVLMMGNKGTTTTPVTPGGTPGVTPQIQPVGPITPLTEGSNVICDITASGSIEGQQMSMSGTTKIEGRKMRSDMTVITEGLTIETNVIINGNMMYMYNPMMGGWAQLDISSSPEAAGSTATQWEQLEGKSPQEVANYLKSSAEANPSLTGGIVPVYTCRSSGDIADSEFQLPPGVTATDMSQLLGELNTTV